MGKKIRVQSTDAANKLIGQKIAMRRKLLGISQAVLGDKLGVSFQQIQKYEKGMNRVSGGSLVTIAAALGCDVTDLMPARSARQDGEADELLTFMATREGIQLARAFRSLPDDGNLRRQLIRTIEAISQDGAL